MKGDTRSLDHGIHVVPQNIQNRGPPIGSTYHKDYSDYSMLRFRKGSRTNPCQLKVMVLRRLGRVDYCRTQEIRSAGFDFPEIHSMF